jgi:hypothetical protein
MKNANVQKAMKVVTIAGSAVLVLNAAMDLTKATGIKSAAMPLVTILVGIAAFNYAMGTSVVVERK